ncbi:lipid A export permease/ATP-binding protein MsbA [Pseudomaricurvus sp. HS19]|uniref:lipid A export permease/ATP-binding protein MsbA n=1 Tax=Pseudomaricurvus sp. HS19 TaxID=2692626 RepID=UPI0013683CC2|nr:lipid A export permease/ATP-binding protein MsbA [Pseudomaricurvus sp. HS19]MYM63390.1 lipid A export permease/ATP-binding protein MsbA [Pseudomaricurvus sp. HS19]
MKATESGNAFRTYLRLLKYLRPLIIPFVVSIVGFTMFASSQAMMAKMMELIIEALNQKNSDARLYLPAAAVGIFMVRGLGTFLGTYYNEYVGAKIIHSLREDIFAKLLVLPAEYYDRTSHGQIMHRVSSGVGQVKAAVTNALKKLIQEGLSVIVLLGYAFYLNWELSLVFLVAAPILGLLVSRTGKYFRKYARRNEAALSQGLQILKETLSNFMVVRTFGAEGYESKRYNKALSAAFKTQMKIRLVQACYSPISQTIIAMAVAAIVALLLDPAILEKYTTGELVGYLTAIALIPKPMRQLSGVGVIIQRGIIGAELVFEVLDADKERDTGTHESERVKGEIEIRNLTFSYPSLDKPVLNSISLNVKAGEMVALVGRSGSGKTTLASLLYRHYQVQSGAIFVDGVDVNDYRLGNLRQQFSVVGQGVTLFDDTVFNNIGYGMAQYGEEEIRQALARAEALDFVEQLPDGIHSVVGENGSKLSGGQRQRLAIARAFLKDAPILILDEATSALDNESEAKITAAIEELAKSRTTIVIAHRLSTIQRADRLIVMEDGVVKEEGSHQQLLQNGEYYKRLYSAEYLQQGSD